MRDPDTPAGERQRLFEKMAAAWEAVPIPDGILEAGSLHALEETVVFPGP